MTALRLFLISLLRTKRVFWTLAVDGLLLFGLSGAGTPTTYGQSLSLVWSDEFNSVTSSNVDTTKWNFDTGNGGSNPGWGNNEFEFYTSRTNNAYVAGGLLHIRAQIESTNGFRYTSARMKTQYLFWTTYGRIEWRAKLPAGVGLWPALWMLGTNIDSIGWPGCGEIDVVENNAATITFEQGSIHSGSDATQIYNFTGGNSVTNFNVYDLDWTSNSITWSVNGVAYETQTSWGSSTGNPYPFPFNQPFFLLMNLAVGGNYLGNPSTNSINPSLPNEMQVDYVRVYNFVTPTAPPATPTGLTATGGDSFVTLNWNVSSNATSYYVKRALVSGGPYTTNANPTANSYTDTGVTNCMTYYYVVSGVNAGGESTNSDEAAASVGASIAVAPASGDFGAIVTGSTAQVSFVVTNPCGATLAGTAVVGGTPFAIASGSPFNIAGFGSTNVVVSFTPTSAGSFTDQVIFASTGGASTNPVTGVGITPGQLLVTPGSHNFGAIATGTTVQTSFTVSNTGGSALTGSASVGAPFAIMNGSPFSLAGFASTNVVVSFTPPGVGAFSANVIFTSTVGNSTNAVSGSTVTNSVPQFTSPPTATNILGTVGNVTLVKPNEAIGFSVGSFDADGNLPSCLWNFGDGSASVDCNPSHVFTNCGPQDVSVTIGDGFASVTTGMTVAVTCPMGISRLKLQAKFKKVGSDTCAIKGTLTDLPTDFALANAAVALDVGDMTVDFQLDAGGRGVNSNGNIKFSYNKKTGTRTFTGKLKGDLKASWAKYGITSGISINANVTFPVLLMLQSDTLETFDAEPPLNYSNRSGTSGTGTYVPVK